MFFTVHIKPSKAGCFDREWFYFVIALTWHLVIGGCRIPALRWVTLVPCLNLCPPTPLQHGWTMLTYAKKTSTNMAGLTSQSGGIYNIHTQPHPSANYWQCMLDIFSRFIKFLISWSLFWVVDHLCDFWQHILKLKNTGYACDWWSIS